MNNSGTLVDRRLEAGDEDKVAIRYGDQRLTYAHLHADICAAGNFLEARGVGREDRVLMVLDDSPAFVALFLGAMRMGAVPAPVSFLDTTENFAHYARDSYAKLIVAEDALLERVPAGAMGRAELEIALQRHQGDRDPADTHPDDMAFWLFSGGSTGFPKGVVHLHHDIPYTCEHYAREILQITADDVTFSSTKLYHAYGLGNNLTFPYSVGATTVLRPGKPDPKGLLQTAQDNQPTLFFSVPTLYGAMVNLPEASSFDLGGRVRFCVSAAEPLAPEVLRRWQSTFGKDIVDGIGSTEMLHIYCSNRPGDVRPGTSGKPVPGYELKLLDESDNEVQPGETGNLYVKGDSALAFYWHQHEKTQNAVKGEWFFTGDRYSVNDNGDYVYEGRADDMIKIGGLWASPIEIENVLVEHPRVLEAAAVGIDADFTTRVKAFVICRGETGDEALTLELQEWCKSRMRRYEYPHFIEFVDELPKTPTGKIQRYKLPGRHMIFTQLPQTDWEQVETALADAFRRAQQAARDGEPILFVLSQEDLLGQRGAPSAILANALLSGMRTLAAEGHRANAVAVGADTDPEDLQHWIALLEEGRGVAGELVRVHAKHVGKIQL